jgi:regulator of sigma E protease
MTIFYLILALLGLGFLIFIHELGHYIMARRAKMCVEVFSIGFGPVLKKWDFQGVKWQLCMLPFGGYVRIAGMEQKKGVEPHQIPEGYYGKSPAARIKVALAGPLANVAFAFVAFSLLWLAGGQQKPFQQFTRLIGYLDPQSPLYEQGVRPGDEFHAVNGKTVHNFQDLAIELMLEKTRPTLQGAQIDYLLQTQEPFSVTLRSSGQQALSELGMVPAQVLIFEDFTSLASPLKTSGIQKGDRLVWADGQLLFSREQLSNLLNASKSLISIERVVDGETTTLQFSVPRLKISDLCLTPEQKNELDDWQYQAGLKSKVLDLYFIPYHLNYDNTVQASQAFLDCSAEKMTPSLEPRTPLATPLQAGDKIVAVDGIRVHDASDLLEKLQTRRALVMIERVSHRTTPSWTQADTLFQHSLDPKSLNTLISQLGTTAPLTQSGQFYLLNPIPLKTLSELEMDSKTRAALSAQVEAQKKQIEKITDPQARNEQLSLLEQSQKRLILGAILRDEIVSYNPPPTTLFTNVFDQTWRTLTSLITGGLSPKALAGPVGIVQALQSSWATGLLNALYWLGFVSLNLAILNLLPIPVLDGGHILFAAIEGITKKPIKARTMERFIIPFMILLVVLFVYLTYQDIVRLLHRLF